MKKIIFLLVMISNVFTYELYKEIKINDVSNDLISILNGLKVDLDHVHVESDNSIKFAVSETDLKKNKSNKYSVWDYSWWFRGFLCF